MRGNGIADPIWPDGFLLRTRAHKKKDNQNFPAHSLTTTQKVLSATSKIVGKTALETAKSAAVFSATGYGAGLAINRVLEEWDNPILESNPEYPLTLAKIFGIAGAFKGAAAGFISGVTNCRNYEVSILECLKNPN